MEIESLKKHLFTGNTRVFCVLDGASVPDLPVKLYQTDATNYCLLPGELTADLLYAAPYRVHLEPNGAFTDWVLGGGMGNHWGIFVQSTASMTEMRKHFRGLITVFDEKGDPMMFRYYDPRVLRKFLPTSTPDELKTFFGRVDAFFAESEDGESIHSFRISEDGLKQSELS
jgi:hypothetical protein